MKETKDGRDPCGDHVFIMYLSLNDDIVTYVSIRSKYIYLSIYLKLQVNSRMIGMEVKVPFYPF